MSAKLREDFLGESSQIFGYREESWQEEAPLEVDEFEYHHDEPEKKYLLIFNEQSQSVRLEQSPLASAIRECIERSRHILTLGDNWDEEGSVGYKESTWAHATDLVRDLAVT